MIRSVRRTERCLVIALAAMLVAGVLFAAPATLRDGCHGGDSGRLRH